MTDSEPLPPGIPAATAAVAIDAPVSKTPVTADMRFGSAPPLLLLTPMSLSLLAQARQETTRGNHQFAVVLAQAACDLRAEDAIIELMRHRGVDYLSDAVLGMFDTTSFGNERLRKIFVALTGDDPAQAPWWSEWRKGRKLRHDVAHAGEPVTPVQAASCIDAAAAFIDHVTAVVEQAR